MKTFAIIPDVHAPLHNRRSWGAMMNALNGVGVDAVVQLGDFFDLETLSSHDRVKPSPIRLKHEIAVGRALRADLDELTDEKYITLGNHENRLPRYLMKKAPELYESVNVPDLFGLAENGWNVTDYLDTLSIGKMLFTHTLNPSWVGANAVDRSGVVAGKSIVIGHVHRSRTVYFGKITGKRYVAHCPGWLGDDSAAEYMSKAQIYAEWQQGFTLGYQEPNGTMHLCPVPIIEGKCVVEGKLYRA